MAQITNNVWTVAKSRNYLCPDKSFRSCTIIHKRNYGRVTKCVRNIATSSLETARTDINYIPSVKSVAKGKNVEEEAMWKCIRRHESGQLHVSASPSLPNTELEAAYARCGEVTSSYAKTFYMGTQLMTPLQAKATWAVYVWCRRTDELVDGPNASSATPELLDKWEQRLEAIFAGKPYDALDAALTDTVSLFPVDIQPFRDMIEGMRMDLVKSRYSSFDELYEYCYRVAGTVALMTTPIMGVDPRYKGSLEPVYRSALALGTANQLTNILRDCGEDALQRNRIYLPLDELRQFNVTEEEVLRGLRGADGHVDERWRLFMQFQIERALKFFKAAEPGVSFLDEKARWPVWSALIMYRQILDVLRENKYDNFSRRAYVPKWQKILMLPYAFLRSRC